MPSEPSKSKVPVSTRLPREIVERMQKLADIRGVELKVIVEEVMKRGFEKLEKNHKAEWGD